MSTGNLSPVFIEYAEPGSEASQEPSLELFREFNGFVRTNGDFDIPIEVRDFLKAHPGKNIKIRIEVKL